MSGGVSDKDLGWERIQRELKRLNNSSVTVGVHGFEDSELVENANRHEFGSREWTVTSKQAYFMARVLMGIDPTAEPGRFWGTYRSLVGKKMQIPERSFMRASFDQYKAAYREAMRRSWREIVAGRRDTDEQLRRFGEFIQKGTRQFATALSDPANAPLTRHVKGSSNPLVNTGRTIQSIRYVVTTKGQEVSRGSD